MILKEQGNKQVYSDGDETEQRMMKIAAQYPEDKAEDYIAHNSFYTINNTFSAVRRNILNWYPFKPDADILEVGAGMGAITGMLCDKAKSVVAVEMNQVRAEIIRTRYPRRNNLQVISEDLNSWQTEQRFDYVVFIGVLEYAAIFSESPAPYDEFMGNIRRLLKPDGRTLFAIENRFGLKYWLGASEDHLQKPFAGIRGYEGQKKTPRTFSRQELARLLERTGFSSYRFYGVLPDYKFPELIFAEDYKPYYMNLKKITYTYSRNSELVADERNLYKDVIENNVFPFFANSFLVEASLNELEDRHVLQVSAKGEVYKEYRVSTIMDSDGEVRKVAMHPNAAQHIRNILENTRNLSERGIRLLPVAMENGILVSRRFDGSGAQEVFREALGRNDRELLHRLLDCLLENFKKSSDLIDYSLNNILEFNGLAVPGIAYGPILQRAYIDMTFYNAFWADDQLIFFDQEWCFERVPLHFCLYYALKSVYYRADVETEISFQELLAYWEIHLDETPTYDRLEEFIWSKILYRQTDFYGEDGYCNRYDERLTWKAEKEKIQEEIRQKTLELDQKNEEIVRLQREISQCDTRLEQRDKEIGLLQEQIAGDNAVREKLEGEITRKDAQMAELEKEMTQKDIQMAELQRSLSHYQEIQADFEQQLRNKNGHIEQLLEKEREYEREKGSRTYRLALKFRKISLLLFPVNSRRRFLARLLLRTFRHPIQMIKLVNSRRIKNGLSILKTEGGESAENHLRLVEEYEKSVEVPLPECSHELLAISEQEKRLDEYEKISFHKWEDPLVSIIIPVYNQFNYTYQCLQAILQNSGDIKYEVIIANDCSDDRTCKISEIIDGATVLNNEINLKFLHNCNNAAKHANGKYLLFLNNDTQVQKNWLFPLVHTMEKDDSIGMIGSKLIYPDGYLQEAGGILWKDGSAWNYGNRQNPNDSEYNYVRETDYISGASIMIRTDLWKEIGGFDTRFAPAYCEDADLAFEVRRHGYKVMYQPLSVVMHFEGVSNGTDLSQGQKKYQIENQAKFREKWKDVLEKEHFENGKDVFLARDRGRRKRHVLVIDHYVPQYDKDAGSRTMYMYLKMLLKKGYHITFLGDNFYPHEPYTSELQQLGVFILHGPKYAEHWQEWLMEHISYYDVFYLNRPHITIKYIDIIKKYGRGKILYYGVDLHFLRVQREAELNGSAELLRQSEEWLEKELYIMRRTDMNYYPSTLEVEEVHKLDPLIPVKAMTAYVYENFRNIRYQAEAREGLLFVGGFGHDPNLDAVMWFLEEIYPEVYRRIHAPFYIVGSNPPEKITKLKIDGVVVKGFISDQELEELYDSCRMTVVPLRFGAGVKGKVLEALYQGLPVVTTSIGAEGIPGVEDIVIVRDSAEELINIITEIYGDQNRLKTISEKSQELVRNYFSMDAVWDVVKDDFG